MFEYVIDAWPCLAVLLFIGYSLLLIRGEGDFGRKTSLAGYVMIPIVIIVSAWIAAEFGYQAIHALNDSMLSLALPEDRFNSYAFTTFTWYMFVPITGSFFVGLVVAHVCGSERRFPNAAFYAIVSGLACAAAAIAAETRWMQLVGA